MSGAPFRVSANVGRGAGTLLHRPQRWRWDRSRDKMEIAMPHYRIRRKPIPVDTLPSAPCQYDWLGGCDKTATWRVGCGPDVRFYCDSHEGPPCGGVFHGKFVITPDTTREELVGVVRCGRHRINSPSGRNVHDLRCCACWEWIGDTRDPYIKHVSIPRQAECLPERSHDTEEVPCRVCEEMWAATPSTTPPETS